MSRSMTPPANVGQLQEKANKALEELLANKSSIDAHRQKAAWELGMDLCWNSTKTVESIKEIKAICSCDIQEAEAICSVAIKEAETICSAAIREAETQGASHAVLLHRHHAEVIKHLEEQVIQEEVRSQIDFLSTCQAALNTSPGEFRGTLVASYHLLLGQASSSHPFPLSQGAFPAEQPPASAVPPVLAPEHSPQTQKATTLPRLCGQHATGQNHVQGSHRRAP